MTDMHVHLRRIIDEDWLTIPGQDKLKQRAMDILDKWNQLLLNNFDDYYWARVPYRSSLEPLPHVAYDHLSLVYVPEDKRRGERYFPTHMKSDLLSHALFLIALRKADALRIFYGLTLVHPFEETLWHREYVGERRTSL